MGTVLGVRPDLHTRLHRPARLARQDQRRPHERVQRRRKAGAQIGQPDHYPALMDAFDAIAALAKFGTGLSQHARLITLASAQERALPESLMAELFTGREAVNELFVFDV